ARRPARDEPPDDGGWRARDDLLARGRHAAARSRRGHLSRPPARCPAARRRGGVLRHLAGAHRRRRVLRSKEKPMRWFVLALMAVYAADLKVDLSKEQVGRRPTTFEPMVGTWIVAQDGADKVIMVDGRPWVASKDNPTRLLIESARRLYGTSNEELMDNAKQFAYFPVAMLKSGVDNFSNGTIAVKFRTISGDADRAS